MSKNFHQFLRSIDYFFSDTVWASSPCVGSNSSLWTSKWMLTNYARPHQHLGTCIVWEGKEERKEMLARILKKQTMKMFYFCSFYYDLTSVNFKGMWSEVKVTQLRPILSDSMDYTVHRILRPGYCTGWPFPSSRDLPNPGIKPRSSALQADSLPTEPPGKSFKGIIVCNKWQESWSNAIWLCCFLDVSLRI